MNSGGRRAIPAPPGHQPARGGGARTALALALVFLVGALAGVALSFLLPSGALFAAERQRAKLLADTGGALADAASFGDDEDPALHPAAALAHALLAVDHGGGAGELARAGKLLQTTVAFVREAPESLFARALLAHMGVEDKALDDDLQKRGAKLERNPWWLLASAERALDAGKRDDAAALAERAALGENAPLQAQALFARLALARGRAGDALALARRIVRRAPEHIGGVVTGILAAAVVDAQDESPEHRAVKLKKVKQRAGPRKDGPPKPGEVRRDEDADVLKRWHTDDEQAAIDGLGALDEVDAPIVALMLEALAVARSDDELASRMKQRVMPAVTRSSLLAARQAELLLLDGDTTGADEVLQLALEKMPGDRALVVDEARVHALGALSDDERHKRASSFTKKVTPQGLVLPFGRMAFDALAPTLPLVPEPSPAVFPETAFAAVDTADVQELRKKLDVAVLVHKGESALLAGDLTAASTAVAAARGKVDGDSDVLFLDARIRIRQGDRSGARGAIDAALRTAPGDPHVLLTAARLHYDNEDFIPARKALAKLRALGVKSPAALALGAMLEARSGDTRSAQAQLDEARSMGADDVETLAAGVLLLRAGKDLEEVRKAATRLWQVDQLHATDPILRAWEADAAAREGDTLRAEAVLKEVIAARPNLADAYLLLGSIQAGTDPTAAVASFADAIARAPGSAVAAEAARRRAALPGGEPVPKPRRGRHRGR